jgi:rubrerythrin
MVCAASHDVIERLNSLLRVELAAVAGYQTALRAVKKKAVVDSDHLLQLASEHQRTVAVLRGSVHARGGAPVLAADPWGASVVASFNGNSASAVLERTKFVGALLEVERRALAEYEAALTSLDDDARELIELELIPRQQRHVARLSSMLDHLPA